MKRVRWGNRAKHTEKYIVQCLNVGYLGLDHEESIPAISLTSVSILEMYPVESGEVG